MWVGKIGFGPKRMLNGESNDVLLIRSRSLLTGSGFRPDCTVILVSIDVLPNRWLSPSGFGPSREPKRDLSK